MNKENKIYVAGHRGMVGSAIVRRLQSGGYENLVFRTRSELDLTDQAAVNEFFKSEKPEYVFLAAAKVGGIVANNTYPAEFIYSNLMVETNVIHAAYENKIKRLLFLGSSCIYPRLADQPMSESALLTGTLEPTNEPYAVAKIAGIKLCESYNRQYGTDYRSVMPTNLYGQGDNFELEKSHVIPALIRKFHDAKENDLPEVVIWGSGSPKREFLHVDDMADACLHVIQLEKSEYEKQTDPMVSHINVGIGVDVTIRELAETIMDVVGYRGDLKFDATKPDGPPRKLLNVDKLEALGWKASLSLNDGIRQTYDWFTAHYDEARGIQG